MCDDGKRAHALPLGRGQGMQSSPRNAPRARVFGIKLETVLRLRGVWPLKREIQLHPFKAPNQATLEYKTSCHLELRARGKSTKRAAYSFNSRRHPPVSKQPDQHVPQKFSAVRVNRYGVAVGPIMSHPVQLSEGSADNAISTNSRLEALSCGYRGKRWPT